MRRDCSPGTSEGSSIDCGQPSAEGVRSFGQVSELCQGQLAGEITESTIGCRHQPIGRKMDERSFETSSDLGHGLDPTAGDADHAERRRPLLFQKISEFD